MDSFEWNKIFGAVLGTVLFVATLNILVNGLMTPHKAEKPWKWPLRKTFRRVTRRQRLLPM
jgi:hypothetical protein